MVTSGHEIIRPKFIRGRSAMAKESQLLDISDNPQLSRLAAEVSSSQVCIVLVKDGEELAEIRPAKRRIARDPGKAEKALEAFRSAAGGWRGLIDSEQLKRDLKAARGSDRPPVQL